MKQIEFKKKELMFLGLLLSSFLWFYGCEVKPKSIGADNEIAILIDSDLKEKVENSILNVFCPIIMTPQPEYRFIPIFGKYEDLDRFKSQKYLLLVGTLDTQGKLSEFIQGMLSAEILEGVTNGDYFVFTKEEEWAKSQLMMIVITADAPSLKEKLVKEPESLFGIFSNNRNEVVASRLFRSHEQNDLAKDIRERFGFNLRIPHDYVLVREEPEEGWLRIKRAIPDRWITLWQSEILTENPIDSAWVSTVWANLASKFADEITTNPDYLRFEKTQISGYPGITLSGLWETVGSKGGGPFFCRAFYNPADHKVYLLEGEVFNPGDLKEPYIKQLEVILDTFIP